jgi:hypothetical protein
MKALMLNDKHIAFFNDRVSNESIMFWVQLNLDLITNPFNLCEPCTCSCFINDNEIEISGDEDFQILKIETIIPQI